MDIAHLEASRWLEQITHPVAARRMAEFNEFVSTLPDGEMEVWAQMATCSLQVALELADEQYDEVMASERKRLNLLLIFMLYGWWMRGQPSAVELEALISSAGGSYGEVH